MKYLHWGYKGKRYRSRITEHACTRCGMRSVVALPAAIRAGQHDDTTHVCHPSLGGCNQGFALEAVEVVVTA